MTEHGTIQTPVFMPVGTAGSVKSLDSQDVIHSGAQIILGNTYHLYLRPGLDVLRKAGGLHQFERWSRPILTDSGGFQVFSLAKNAQSTTGQGSVGLVTVTEEAVEFTSHLDGSKHSMSPEQSMAIQRVIGSDICMAFDHVIPDSSSRAQHEQAVARTTRWAERCKIAWETAGRESEYGTYQALFGIVQGGLHEDLRRASLRDIAALAFDGIALGGETIGYDMPGTAQVMTALRQHVPAHVPRYAMGLGRDPQDIIDAVLLGFDMFDCVGPTRLARNGALFSGQFVIQKSGPAYVSPFPKGRISIGAAQFAQDHTVLSSDCGCATCTAGYTRAYLHHLYRSKELSYYRLASIHNITTMVKVATSMRNWIHEHAN